MEERRRFPEAFIAMTCVLLAIPLYLLIVGIIKLDSCSADSRIPIWMICTSAIMIIERMMESMNQAMDLKFVNNNPRPEITERRKLKEWENERYKNRSTMLFAMISLSRVAIFVTTIVGSAFVFSAYSNRSQCDGLLYWSAFVFCIVSLVIFLLGGVVIGGMFCIMLIVGKRNNKVVRSERR
ncbi:hypothetical protein CRE_29747 [Caenorhabditis remanei]|uniref:Uncharacterized protein n=2 Tax=Caenorhabditis remanei TaxID=31234 RepID=E3LVK0_CAERE|nr:hypothetical protein CRE_29747 [Caenorhabditis remanei]